MDLSDRDLTAFADEVGPDGPVTISGTGSRGGAVPDVRRVVAPAGIEWIQADEMTVSVGAGTTVDELSAALAEVGQRTVLPPGGTVGGALADGRSGIRRLGDGPARDALLQATYVNAEGRVVTAGGPTVKNVSGFDVCRLLVGSRGTLGFLGSAILRTRPISTASRWFTAEAADPFATFALLHRPVSVLWNGSRVWALLEGHPHDIAAQAAAAGLTEADGPPAIPAGSRRICAPSAVRDQRGDFVAEVGIGIVHHVDPAPDRSACPPLPPARAALGRRIKEQFDPSGRLNPGVVVA